MATAYEDLTSQVDGITDTFTTLNDISGGLLVDYNGLTVNVNDITVLGSNSFQISFVPKINNTLAVFTSPEKFNITSQVDGSTKIFTEDPSDTGTIQFIAILNGQILAQETQTIDENTFKLPFAPQLGDQLEYIRAVLSTVGTSIIAKGTGTKFSVLGKITKHVLNGKVPS